MSILRLIIPKSQDKKKELEFRKSKHLSGVPLYSIQKKEHCCS